MNLVASLLTSNGRGAIASIRISGRSCCELVEKHFESATEISMRDVTPRRILFGKWHYEPKGGDSAQPTEELVVCKISADCVEIHSHGGDVAPRMILDSLHRSGCEIANWQSTSVFKNQIEKDATHALLQATTQRTAAVLLHQLNGALALEFKSILIDIDSKNTHSAQAKIRKLLDWAPLGLHLTQPWRVVIAGAPNVGKSSLINVILGFQRAIVFHQPGTTRDVVAATTAFDGWPFELFDTAGIRATEDDIETQGIELAFQRMDEADLIVEVTDQPSAVRAHRLANSRKPIIRVRNKMDLHHQTQIKQGVVHTSAKNQSGIDELISAILSALIPQDWTLEAPIPFTKNQWDALNCARKRLEQSQCAEATAILRPFVSQNGSTFSHQDIGRSG